MCNKDAKFENACDKENDIAFIGMHNTRYKMQLKGSRVHTNVILIEIFSYSII